MGEGDDEQAAAMNLKWRQRIGRVPRAWRLAYVAAAAVAGAASGPVELRLHASLPAAASLLAALPAPDAARGPWPGWADVGAVDRGRGDPRCAPGAVAKGCPAPR